MFKFFKRKQEKVPPKKQRGYDGASRGRLTSDWFPGSMSADMEINSSLTILRNRSRDMVRNNPYAVNAQRIVRNNVVGVGIGFQSQIKDDKGQLINDLNTEIEEKFRYWCRKQNCHTAGLLSLNEICQVIMNECFEAGEIIIRKVYKAFGDSYVPYALEVIEADRLAEQYSRPVDSSGRSVRMGVERDQWGRPTAYYFHRTHPGDLIFGGGISEMDLVRVPAKEIFHLYIMERFPQTRGIPWMHSAIRRLRDTGGYTEAEIVAARASANIAGFIRSEASDEAPEDKEGEVFQIKPGAFLHLAPGEDVTPFTPNRQTAAIEPFMRFMIREIAAGIGVSYESLSRDYSQSNYSSSRLSLLDDRVVWRILQGWLISNFLQRVFKDWMDMAVLSGELKLPNYEQDPRRYCQIRFRPPGWSWIDPTKEVQAYKEAVKAGFMTVGDVIAQTGQGSDFEDTMKARRSELDLMDSMNLSFDTNGTSRSEPPPVTTDGDKKE